MEDLTLTSDLFNNIKFNMQKLILDVASHDIKRLSEIFNAPLEDIKQLIFELDTTVRCQAAKLKQECGIPEITKKQVIAFVGDSITSDRTSYFNILKKMFEDDDRLTFVDAAISGDKSDDAVMKFYLRTLKYKPDIVHILVGTNDLRHNDDKYGKSAVSLEEYRQNLCYMIQTLKNYNIIVILSQISPVVTDRLKCRFPEDNWTYDEQEIFQLNKIILEVANEYGVEVNAMEKVYAQYSPQEILLRDGLHLNEKGQYLLAKNVLCSLKQYL